ncbi:MAG: polyprenyl synthetase family protein, partial [Acidobacteriota bacterium]|nr:polyprenyl synthetase family protein [Acidobacteriota bacterium]
KCTQAEKAKVARVIDEGGFYSVQFDEILELIERYDILDAARAKAQHFARLAGASLAGTPESQYKDALCSLAEFIAEREF